MLSRQRRPLEVLSISALDLFASALGVFILMAVVLFPFYLRQPALEAELLGARREAASADAALTEAQRKAVDAAARRGEAEARLQQALRERAQAEEEQAEAEQALKAARARISAADEEEVEKPRRQEHQAAFTIGDLDLVFVMDTTGSMRDEIQDLQRTLLSMIRILARLAPSLRIGFVAFKDRTDSYLTLAHPLAPMTGANRLRIQAFVTRLRAGGGGDKPEPIADALRVAINMPWRSTAKGRIIVISDAPAHGGTWRAAFDMAAAFRASAASPSANRRVSAIFTGRNTEGRLFYQRLIQAGGGDLITHRGRMMESVLLSVLDKPSAGGARGGSTAGPG